jgi:hypothetical protein
VAAIPYAAIQLPRSDSFIPVMFATIFIAEFVSALLIFAQYSATPSYAVLWLGSCYVFSCLMAVAHALTFPGALAPTGLLGAGPQSAAWLHVLWRLGLIASMTGYAVLRPARQAKDMIGSAHRSAILCSVTIAIALACLAIFAVTAGKNFLPPVTESLRMLPLGHYVNGFLALANVLALLLLLVLTRGRSILDLWLTVEALALLAEATMLTFSVPARFSLSFYAVRIISLPVSNIVLIVLLWETKRLQANLAFVNQDLRRDA